MYQAIQKTISTEGIPLIFVRCQLYEISKFLGLLTPLISNTKIIHFLIAMFINSCHCHNMKVLFLQGLSKVGLARVEVVPLKFLSVKNVNIIVTIVYRERISLLMLQTATESL